MVPTLGNKWRKVDHPMRDLDTTAKSNQCWNKSGSYGRTRRTQKNAAMRKRLDPNPVCRSKQRGNSKGSECGRRKKSACVDLEIDWKDEKESKGNLRGKFVNRGVEQRGRRSQSEPPLLAPTCPLLDKWNSISSANQSLRSR